MIWTALRVSNETNKPDTIVFNGPEDMAKAYDLARFESNGYFIVGIVPGENDVYFGYESIALLSREGELPYPSEVSGFLEPKFRTRTLN